MNVCHEPLTRLVGACPLGRLVSRLSSFMKYEFCTSMTFVREKAADRLLTILGRT